LLISKKAAVPSPGLFVAFELFMEVATVAEMGETPTVVSEESAGDRGMALVVEVQPRAALFLHAHLAY